MTDIEQEIIKTKLEMKKAKSYTRYKDLQRHLDKLYKLKNMPPISKK